MLYCQLLSERTRISGTAADLLCSAAPRLSDRFDALVGTFVPALLTICARTNKVALKRASKTLQLICTYCRLPASLLPLLRESVRDKAPSLRAAAVEAATTLVRVCGEAGGAEMTEEGGSAAAVAERLRRRGVPELVEAIIKSSATDASVEVRAACKKLFEVYVERLPERVER